MWLELKKVQFVEFVVFYWVPKKRHFGDFCGNSPICGG